MRAGEMGFTTAEVGDLVVARAPLTDEGDRPARARKVELYDTTLRDGAQGTGLSYSIEDRLRILHKIDQLGVPLHRGWLARCEPARHRVLQARHPGTLRHATLTSFGMTRKAGERAQDQRRAPRAARHRYRGRLSRGQVVGPARDRGVAHGSG